MGLHSNESATSYRSSHLDKGDAYDAAIASNAFGAYMARLERDLLLRVVPDLFPERIRRYLDFACGTGRIMETVAPFADTTIGVDVSGSMLARAHARCPDSQLIQHDVTAARLDIDSVDLVTAFRFLGNAEPALRRDALHAISDLLVPGGYLIANNHRNAASFHNLVLRARGRSDGSSLTHGTLSRLLDEARFEIVSTFPIGMWVVRYGMRRATTLESSRARMLERSSRIPGLARFAPDLVVVARRRLA